MRDPGAGGEPEFRVYRTTATSTDLPWKPILVTAAIAFLIAAAALTLPELIAGQSVGGGDRNFTLFGGESREDETSVPDERTQPAEEETAPGRQATEPEKTVPELQPTPDQTVTEETTSVQETETTTAPGGQTPAP